MTPYTQPVGSEEIADAKKWVADQVAKLPAQVPGCTDHYDGPNIDETETDWLGINRDFS